MPMSSQCRTFRSIASLTNGCERGAEGPEEEKGEEGQSAKACMHEDESLAHHQLLTTPCIDCD